MLHYQLKNYSELSINEFHDLIALRIAIFVIEQNCPYQELDGKDKKSYHVLGQNKDGEIKACARILPSGLSYPEVSIGRVLLTLDLRGTGEGHKLMDYCLQSIKAIFGMVDVRISAQAHLEKFYNSHAFISTGKTYLEDGIPHVEMLLTSK